MDLIIRKAYKRCVTVRLINFPKMLVKMHILISLSCLMSSSFALPFISDSSVQANTQVPKTYQSQTENILISNENEEKYFEKNTEKYPFVFPTENDNMEDPNNTEDEDAEEYNDAFVIEDNESDDLPLDDLSFEQSSLEDSSSEESSFEDSSLEESSLEDSSIGEDNVEDDPNSIFKYKDVVKWIPGPSFWNFIAYISSVQKPHFIYWPYRFPPKISHWSVKSSNNKKYNNLYKKYMKNSRMM